MREPARTSDHPFMLDDVLIDPQRNLIVADRDHIQVEPKVMQVLMALAAHQQHVVSKDELLEQVWSGAFVGEEVVSRAISLLRAALGDNAHHPRFIRTVPRRGYELLMSTTPVLKRPLPRRFATPAALFGLTALLLGLAYEVFTPDQTVVRIGAFDTTPQHRANTEQLQLDLIALLSSDALLMVRPVHDGQAAAPGVEATTPAHADVALRGTLRHTQGQLRLNIELADPATNTAVWSMGITASTFEEVDYLTKEAVRGYFNEQHGTAISASDRQANIERRAYRSYIAAQHHWSLRGEPHLRSAQRLLTDAIDLQPDFAEAHLGLARVFALQPFYGHFDLAERFVLARAASTRAQQLDPSLANDVRALDGFMLTKQRQWQAAEQTLRQVLHDEPGHSLANYWLSILLASLGRNAEALEYGLFAVTAEPTSAVLRDRLAISRLWTGDVGGAGLDFAKARELGLAPNARSKAHILYLIRSRQFQALADEFLTQGLPPSWVEAFVSALQTASAKPRAVEHTLRAAQEGRLPEHMLFGIWVLLEEPDRAIATFPLQQTASDIEFLWAPESAKVRAHGNFPQLLAKLNLN